VRFRQHFAALALIVGGNLFAEFKADFGVVPGCYLNAAVFFSSNGQRLIGNGLDFLVANIGPVISAANSQMVAAIIAGGLITYCDGAVALIGVRRPDAESQEESQQDQFFHASPRSFKGVRPVAKPPVSFFGDS